MNCGLRISNCGLEDWKTGRMDETGAREIKSEVSEAEPFQSSTPSILPVRNSPNDPIFQPTQLTVENSIREFFTTQIHIVSNAAKQTIDA